MAKRQKKVRKIDWKAFDGMSEDDIYSTHIYGWNDFSEAERELCKKANNYRVKALCLPPIIHPDVVTSYDL